MLRFLKSWREKKNSRVKKASQIFLLVLFFGYLAFIIWFLLIYGRDGQEKVIPSEYNIIPFAVTSFLIRTYIAFEYDTFYLGIVIRNVLGNLVLFIPFGVLASLLSKKSLSDWMIVLSSCLLSVVLEGVQYTLGVGIFDVDDIIYNTLGAWIGLMMLRLFIKDNRTHVEQGQKW
jgi:glycopeptide antibiotics resistance protein